MNGIGHPHSSPGGVTSSSSGARPNGQGPNILDGCVLVSRQVTEQRQERVVTRTEFTSLRKDAQLNLSNGHATTLDSPCRNNHLIHSRSSSLTSNNTSTAPLESGIALLDCGSNCNTLTRKSTTTTVTSSERKTTNLVRELMGPDGQTMEYTHAARPPNAAPADYVPPGQPYARPPHFPPDGPPYDPALVQDPYGYTRGTIPPDPAVRIYNHHVGFGDYEQYPEYGSFSGGYHPDYRPSTPSETSDSPSLHRNHNSEYLRGGVYPPGAYDELDAAGVPRPEYLSPSGNAHPGNYEGGGESRGNGGPYWATNLNNSTSHYGNLPVRPYLLQEGTGIMGNNGNVESSSSPSTHSFQNVPNSNNANQIDPNQRASSSNVAMQMDTSSSGDLQQMDIAPPPLPHGNHSHIHQRSHIQTGGSSSGSNNHSPGVRWRDPDLHEVIQFLGNPNPVVKANAAAYLQHLCYMDDPVKAKTRALGGIPPLVALLSHDQPEVHRNACGALRNLSYGRQNDENKKAIKSAGGIPALVRLLKRTPDNEVKELVTGVLWNLSSCEELKRAIIDDGMLSIVNSIIIPHGGWDRSGVANQHIPESSLSPVFKNASGVVRNVSSAGEYARKKLRECEGLVEALLHVVRCALSRADIDDKSVENCVCILRNLSYRCQEVEDPNYDKHPPPYDKQSRANATPAKGENLGCFGANKKKKEAALASSSSPKDSSNSVNAQGGPTRSSSQQRTEPVKGMELLWQPEVVQSYLALLSNCSNPETLEAAAGAIQNLAACYWQPSIEIRAAVRKEKGLPVLVELLRMEVDRVVCAVATALRNLALDQRNKELIGKYAMRDLVQKLPSGRPGDQNTSDDTIAAVLATLNEVIKKNAEFARSLMEAEGVERLVLLTQQKRRFSPRVVKFASQVLYSMWQHQELREVYKKAGWTESDFVPKGATARGGSPGPSGNEASSAGSPVNPNSTLNRPMASQSGTRYEDKTITRGQNNVTKSPPPNYAQGEEVPLADMPYPDGGLHHPPPGAFRVFPPQPIKPGEPLYAQVNREKKRNRGYDRGYDGNVPVYGAYGVGGDGQWVDHQDGVVAPMGDAPGGDSWV